LRRINLFAFGDDKFSGDCETHPAMKCVAIVPGMLIGKLFAISARLYSGSSVGGRTMSRWDHVGAEAVNGPGEAGGGGDRLLHDEIDSKGEVAGATTVSLVPVFVEKWGTFSSSVSDSISV